MPWLDKAVPFIPSIERFIYIKKALNSYDDTQSCLAEQQSGNGVTVDDQLSRSLFVWGIDDSMEDIKWDLKAVSSLNVYIF